MRLEQITIHNFRQYKGTQKIHFSKDTEKNITVIHGENGTGKTALLNAFNWCLYGKIDLPNADDIINEHLQMETGEGIEAEAYVKLQFFNDGRMYYINRSVKAKKIDGKLIYNDPILSVEYIDIDGKSVTPKAQQDLIDQIIPPDMKSYFFFDGERIDKMQDKDKAKDIKNAIKVVMGLEVLERSIKHLEEVKKKFRNESANLGNEEQQVLNKKIEDISNSIKEKQEEKENINLNRVAVEGEIKDIQNKLRTLEESREIQQQRDVLVKEREKVNKESADLQKKLKSLISKKGYLSISGETIKKAKEFLETKREKNQIPTGIKQQFVEDLLEKKVCICGRTIEEGTEAHEHLLSWREKSSTKALEDAFINTSADLKYASLEREELFKSLQEYKQKENEIKKILEEIDAELSEIQGKLEGKDVEEISNLAKKEREKRDQLEEIRDSIKRIDIDIENYKKELQKLEKEFDSLKIENEKALLAKRRSDTCENLKSAFLEIYNIRNEEVQKRLQEKISEVYSKLLRKGFGIKLSEDYDIEVYKNLGSEQKSVALSQGERQLTSLSFIGALVDIAREQSNLNENSDNVSSIKFGGFYPIVMDSPFGQLDLDHQARVARGLPDLTHQIVIIVSSSQWSGVKEYFEKKVGREYKLEFLSGSKDYTEIIEV